MAKIELVVETDLSQVDEAFTRAAHGVNGLEKEAKELGGSMRTSFARGVQEAGKLDSEVKKGRNDMKGLGQAASAAGRDTSKAFEGASKSAQKAAKDIKKAKDETGGMAKGLDSLKTGIAAAFSIGAVSAFIGKVANTRAEFQKFEAVLTNTLGSKSLAQNALLMIQDVASKTPFSVQELTGSFVKLANQGFEPTSREITKLGDLAASQGKGFDQLAEGIIDAQTGEFERLKEFGIKASKEGDNVKFKFKGVETQVKNNGKAINEYILGLGELEGVSGGMAAISDTLGGKISNLGDNFDSLFNNIGKNTEGIMSSFLDSLNSFLGGLNEAEQKSQNLAQAFKGQTSVKNIFGNDITDFGASEFKKATDFNEKQLKMVAEMSTTAQGLSDASKRLDNEALILLDQRKRGLIDPESFLQSIAILNNARSILSENTKAFNEKELKSAEAAAAEKNKVDEAAKAKMIKNREDLNKALEDLAKKAQDAELADMEANSEEKAKKEREIAMKDIDKLRAEIMKKGKATNSNFALTNEQEQQILILRRQVEMQASDKILEIRKKLIADELNLQKSAVEDAAKIQEGRTSATISGISGQVAPSGVDSVVFEQQKARAIANIRIQAASDLLDIKQQQLDAEAAIEINNAPEKEAAIKARLAAEKDILFTETQNTIVQLQAEIAKMDEGPTGFSLARLLGMSDSDFEKFNQALGKAFGETQKLINQQLNFALNANQKEIDSSKEKQKNYETELSALNGKLNEELKLKEDGAANNTDLINKQILEKQAAIEAEKKVEQERLEEQKRLNKIKLGLDSLTQVSNLLTAGSTLFAKGAFEGPVGIAVAGATIIGMLASFLALRQTAAQFKEGGGFAEGGYTGDGGKYDEAGVVHKGEFVTTKENTTKHRALLEGIHSDNPTLIKKGIFDLLTNTGVSLPRADNLSTQKDLIQENEQRIAKNNNLNGVEKRLDEMNAKFDLIVKSQGQKIFVDGNGNLNKKIGTHTDIIRKRGDNK